MFSGDPRFLRVVSRTVTFLSGGMYHAGQSVPEGILGSTCALQEQTAVLEVVTRTARYCVWWRTLGGPRFLRCHTSRQYHRVDDAETVPPIVTFSARRGRRLSPLSPGPRPRRPHIIIIAPLRSRLVPIRSSFLAPTLTDSTTAGTLWTMRGNLIRCGGFWYFFLRTYIATRFVVWRQNSNINIPEINVWKNSW